MIMKKTMLFVLGAVVLLSASSCKKGANDPFLSLKSRKARLAGEYTVSKLESVEVITGEYSETTITKDFDGTTMFEKTVNSFSQSPESVSYPVSAATWKFNKDGTWEMLWHHLKTVVTEDQYYKTTTETDYTEERSGTWSFIGKIKKQYKNKERVQLSILKEDIIKIDNVSDLNKTLDTTTTSKTSDITNATYSNGESVVVYEIDMLKNKEMIFRLLNNKDYMNSYDDGFNNPYDFTEKTSLEEVMTLTQK